MVEKPSPIGTFGNFSPSTTIPSIMFCTIFSRLKAALKTHYNRAKTSLPNGCHKFRRWPAHPNPYRTSKSRCNAAAQTHSRAFPAIHWRRGWQEKSFVTAARPTSPKPTNSSAQSPMSFKMSRLTMSPNAFSTKSKPIKPSLPGTAQQQKAILPGATNFAVSTTSYSNQLARP